MESNAEASQQAAQQESSHCFPRRQRNDQPTQHYMRKDTGGGHCFKTLGVLASSVCRSPTVRLAEWPIDLGVIDFANAPPSMHRSSARYGSLLEPGARLILPVFVTESFHENFFFLACAINLHWNENDEEPESGRLVDIENDPRRGRWGSEFENRDRE